MGRRHKPTVTKADLARTAEFLRVMGAKVAVAETMPGKVRVITTDGADLTLPDDKENLDLELANYRAWRDGRSGPQGRA